MVDSMLAALESHADSRRQALDELLQRQAGAQAQQQLAAQALRENRRRTRHAERRAGSGPRCLGRARTADRLRRARATRSGWLARQQAEVQTTLQGLDERRPAGCASCCANANRPGSRSMRRAPA